MEQEGATQGWGGEGGGSLRRSGGHTSIYSEAWHSLLHGENQQNWTI